MKMERVSRDAWFQKWLTQAAVVAPLLINAPAEAREADRKLKELSKVPETCSLLITDSNASIEACRADLLERSKEIIAFTKSDDLKQVGILSGRINEKERCAAALPILRDQKQKILDIIRFLGAEIKDDGSDPVSQILFKDTIANLSQELQRTPQANEFVDHTDKTLEKYRREMQECGMLVRGAMYFGLSTVSESIRKRTEPLIKLIDEAIADTNDPERRKRAALAMFQLLSLLEEIAEAGARR